MTLSTDRDCGPAALVSCSGGALWHKSAPAPVLRAQRSGHAEAVWSAWSAYLAKRKKPRRPDRLVCSGRRDAARPSSRRSPLLWAIAEPVVTEETVRLVERLTAVEGRHRRPDASLADEASRWMAEATAARRDIGYAVEAVAWAGALAAVAAHVPAGVWWNLVDHLASTAWPANWRATLRRGRDESPDDADSNGRDGARPSMSPCDDSPLVHQLVAGELALTLAYNLPEIAACRRLAGPARESLSAGLVELLDGEGLPRAEHMPQLRPLLACWTRCRMLGRRMEKDCFVRGVAGQFDWVVREALRWTRADGTTVLGPSDGEALPAEMLAAALDFDRDRDDRRIAAVVLPGRKRASRRASRRVLPEVAAHSEWSRAAVLRTEWAHRGPSLSLVYPDKKEGESPRFLTEFAVRGDVLWSGPWECEIRRDGELAAPTGDWDETCWVSDDDVDYVELEIELAGGIRLERHLVIAHEDRLMLVADVIHAERPGRIEYCGHLPLAADVSIEDLPETREVILAGPRGSAMAIPLALPEWRAPQAAGSLAGASDGLELRQTAEGRAMYCPVLFDLDPRRFDRPRTWRQLTVAESLTVQPADVAVGYRVQIGRRQWLIYRSLAQRANRTLLGHNLSSETLLARFDRHGEVDPLVEVE